MIVESAEQEAALQKAHKDTNNLMIQRTPISITVYTSHTCQNQIIH